MTACSVVEMDKTVVTLVLTALAFVIGFAEQTQFYDFIKTDDGSNAFNYSYKQPNGVFCVGQTLFIFKMHHQTYGATRHFHFIIGENGAVHWLSFSEKECNSTSIFSKAPHPVERFDSGLLFNDHTYEFEVKLNEGVIRVNTIIVQWDFDDICFTKMNDGRNLFRFEVKAKNVPRIVNGETYCESDQMNPLIQRIMVPDEASNYVVEIEFTQQEFNTWNTFCRNITTLINVPFVVRNFGDVHNIDPNALKSLVG